MRRNLAVLAVALSAVLPGFAMATDVGPWPVKQVQSPDNRPCTFVLLTVSGADTWYSINQQAANYVEVVTMLMTAVAGSRTVTITPSTTTDSLCPGATSIQRLFIQ